MAISMFGEGAFSTLGASIDGRRYGLVTYPDTFCQALAGQLKHMAGAPCVTIDDVAPNPDYELLDLQVQRIAQGPRSTRGTCSKSAEDTATN